MHIDLIDDNQELSDEMLALIERLLKFAAEQEKVSSDRELSVTFTNDAVIQSINQQYRNIDEPTDVISFALEDEVEEEIEIRGDDLPVHLGDIVISVERAKEQAKEYNHSFEREIGFLAVHGFLHLLGYDHMTVEEEKEMLERQDHILDDFGLKRHEK